MKKLSFPQTLEISILQKDLDNGIPGTAFQCAITLSTKRRVKNLLKEEFTISTGIFAVNIRKNGEAVARYELGNKGNDFVESFDSPTKRKELKPCRIKLKKAKLS